MAKTPNHLHRYKLVDLGRKGKPYLVYRCMKPACNHYIPVTMSEGKLCECNRCEEPMIINRAVLNGHNNGKPMTRPHCLACTKSKKVKKSDVDAIAEFLKQTGS